MNSTAFRSPFAALIWKEWRESWWLLTLTVLAPAACSAAIHLLLRDPPYGMRLVFATGVFAMLALCLGAGLFAGERANGTSAFEAERPVASGMIWNAKLLAPVVALFLGWNLLGAVVCWLWPPEEWRLLHVSAFDLSCLMLGGVFLVFAAAVFCSVLLDRPVTAWGAGLALAFILGIGAVYLLVLCGWGGQGPSPPVLLLSAVFLAEGVAVLWLSRVVYVRWPGAS